MQWWCAEWADGLITVNAPVETLRRMIGAYRDAGGRGPLALQVHLSWAEDLAEAEAIAKECPHLWNGTNWIELRPVDSMTADQVKAAD